MRATHVIQQRHLRLNNINSNDDIPPSSILIYVYETTFVLYCQKPWKWHHILKKLYNEWKLLRESKLKLNCSFIKNKSGRLLSTSTLLGSWNCLIIIIIVLICNKHSRIFQNIYLSLNNWGGSNSADASVTGISCCLSVRRLSWIAKPSQARPLIYLPFSLQCRCYWRPFRNKGY